ncbi:neutral zinc metallopeptidase [Terricaulis sp.]|uniref:KPN_02809 family neutral zinc metallopeptidase n=1 Tax=Terricaulis sp. TaxID=2768686 RepID=UPI002AC73632|nr:neutral zinc metallopeptidase [Terricaulis sp.]MDZ4692479.1 neutral zinc metallopeptidase [Terricaulis sp.]
MRIGDQRRSDNFQDRGRGSGGGGGGGGGMLFAVLSRLGIRGALLAVVVLGAVYFLMPGMRAPLMGMLGLGGGEVQASGSVCETSAEACDFSRAVLGSTEDVWSRQFAEGRLPRYASAPGVYEEPTLVVFSGAVSTEGCGGASSDVGPFYCPADRRLYIDPGFYQTMETRLNAPGDFAQAYVIAHEVGHHIQNLIGATRMQVQGENQNQTSVRMELQADCLAGVWGHTAQASLAIDEADLREALAAAHAIGDDTLGQSNERNFTHGSSAQRMRWFRRGFDSGDARQCDTFAVQNYGQL